MTLACAGCGRLLLHERHAAPPTADWPAPLLELFAWRDGWRDGLCPDCR